MWAGTGCDLWINTPSQWLDELGDLGDVVGQIAVSDRLVMCCWVVFREVIRIVFSGWFPHEFELFLKFSVFEPPVAHVHGFGATLFDGVVEETHGSCVVEDNKGGLLRETHLLEGESDWNCLFAIMESCPHFTISRGGSNMFEYGGQIDDGPVGDRGFVAEVAHEEVAASTAACFGLIVITGVGMYNELHVRGLEGEACVGMSGTVVKELVYALACLLCWASLFGGEGAECDVEVQSTALA